jgi:hypothetical protein
VTKPRKETIEEYIARGGKITVIPPVKPEDSSNTIPIKTLINYDLMSLGEGEFMFGETRAKAKPMKKRVNDDEFAKMLESANLPSNIVESLKRTIKA